MGLFDSFKKKVKETSEEINPLHKILTDANLGIENLQVVNANGTVTVTGSAQEGEAIEKVNELLAANGVLSVTNNLGVADLSHLGVKYRVATNSSNLNCRKGPSTDNEIVGKFPKDAIVQLVKKHNATWHMVRNDEIEGFCHTDYLEQVQNT
ncbi:MAG: SH3 domain-containing protein [Bacteroidia bacterium]|nr:SH3 domain-containing protein [Bacteroidia bacterium]NNJ55908.1 SH3 domain-containing protein [Bacteroidia bacterium]